MQRITSVKFSRFKAFRDFSLSLEEFNILVGPNNAGKSTILGAFRILSEGIRKARARSSSMVEGPDGRVRGYEVNLTNVPIASENIFYNYDDSEPASILFRTSTGDGLRLFFQEQGACNLICETRGRPITTPSSFKTRFDIEIGIVPILGPVEHNEPLYLKEAAREALLTHRASRNFRNIWYHYPDSFDEFRLLVQETWPGMDIKRPEVDRSHDKPLLHMYCPEDRIDREVFWAGFGFQVWCQMLTFMVINNAATLLVVDEPDIYLHSDLQRQLVAVLKNLGPDILLATHSTEIISEADPHEILIVTKKARSAKRVGDPSQLQNIFNTLGSNLNPTLTQLAKSKRLVYVEGKDFRIITKFAAKLGVRSVALRSDFAVVPTQGFNPVRAKMFSDGVEATLAAKISIALIFDRDYRSDSEVDEELEQLNEFCDYAHIHSKKELENFLLVPAALDRAIAERVADQDRRNGGDTNITLKSEELLWLITDDMKYDVQAHFMERRHVYDKALDKAIDDSTVTRRLLAEFDNKWNDPSTRLDMVPGKEVLARMNQRLQAEYGVGVTPARIIDAMKVSEIANEMREIIDALDSFVRNTRQ